MHKAACAVAGQIHSPECHLISMSNILSRSAVGCPRQMPSGLPQASHVTGVHSPAGQRRGSMRTPTRCVPCRGWAAQRGPGGGPGHGPGWRRSLSDHPGLHEQQNHWPTGECEANRSTGKPFVLNLCFRMQEINSGRQGTFVQKSDDRS
jgi:hypothetical protein